MEDSRTGLEIAIIGMAGRFPGARNITELWKNLEAGVESIVFFSKEELREAGVDEKLLADSNFVPAKGYLANTEYFDADFFEYSPLEAEVMDPQLRILHECAWETLENAGYDPDKYSGTISFFSGAGSNYYWTQRLINKGGHFSELLELSNLNDREFFSTRIAYKLNLCGPAVTVQSACSTSLLTIHLACKSLLSGECDMALAGGVGINLPAKNGYLYQEGMILSPDGHCRAFDAAAQGTVSGDGIGLVLLKRLDDALADGDCIRAIIRGSASNNDGARKAGYTAPGIEGQAAVISAAQYMAEVEPEEISYIETHGTGTVLGDPIEFEGLKMAFTTKRKGYCGLGSVKTNIGHLDNAAGVAGLIKTVLALENRMIPPSLHYNSPNPKINLRQSPFYITAELTPWEEEGPRIAGVSSFGLGGTNVHMILEEAPEVTIEPSKRQYHLFPLSARTETALQEAVKNLAGYLQTNSDLELSNVAYTLQIGRRSFLKRTFVVGKTCEEVVNLLRLEDERKNISSVDTVQETIWLFPHKEAFYTGMGYELYCSEPIFREAVEHCFAANICSELNLKELCYPMLNSLREERNFPQTMETLQGSHIASFITSYALAQFLIHLKIQPYSMMGMGVGEFVAAVLAGVISLEEAVELIVLIERTQIADTGIDSVTFSVLREKIRQVTLNAPEKPYISSITGNWITIEDAVSPEYWSKLMQNILVQDGIDIWQNGLKKLREPNKIYVLMGSADMFKEDDVMCLVKNEVCIPLIRKMEESINDNYYLLGKIGELWTKGVKINLAELYSDENRNRLPLPTYHFEGRCFKKMLEISEEFEQPRLSGVLKKNKNLADWFYIPSWQRSVVQQMKLTDDCNWLFFLNETSVIQKEVAKNLIECLKAQGHKVICVKAGSGYLWSEEEGFTIRPNERADYEALFVRLHQLKKMPHKIVHLWNMSQLNQEVVLDYSLYSILYIAQVLGKFSLDNSLDNVDSSIGNVDIFIVTCNTQEIIGGEGSEPEKATIAGAVQVISQEYPQFLCKQIDIIEPQNSLMIEKCVRQLMTEFAVPHKEKVVAYRGNYRWVQTFLPLPLSDKDEKAIQLKEAGVYLITGGFGGIGLALAEFLAKEYHARLILIGRRTLPERKDWEYLVKSDRENSETLQIIEKVLYMEKLGAQVLLLNGDVTDEVRMREIIRLTLNNFGCLDGVIHAAGVADGALIQRRSREVTEAILAPKVTGTRVLEKVLADVQIDFLLLCSSLSSILAPIGQVGYAAANSFLDAFSLYDAQRGLKTIAVNWDRWQGVGISTIAEKQHQNITGEELKNGMSVEEGVEVFRQILLNPQPQIAISVMNLPALLEENLLDQEIGDSLPGVNSIRVAGVRPTLSTAYIAPTNDVERKLCEIWKDIFGIEQLGVHDDFLELGGNSLKAITLATYIHRNFNVKIPFGEFFVTTTIAGLAKKIQSGRKKDFIAIERAVEREYYPLSAAQQRLFVLNRMEPESVTYNTPEAYYIDGPLDVIKVEEVFQKLIARHESFRISFFLMNDEPVQKIEAQVEFSLEYAIADETKLNTILSSFVRKFELQKAPLLRGGIVKLGAERHVLMIDMPHIISDDLTKDIFIKEFIALYSDQVLPLLRLRYIDFSEWQNRYFTSTDFLAEEEYWLNCFLGDLPVLHLPTDFKRPQVQRFTGKRLSLDIVDNLGAEIQKLAREEEVTLYAVLLAAYYILLSKYSNDKDIIVGSPLIGRTHADLHNVIGCFVNTLALRNYPDDMKRFSEFLLEVKKNVFDAFEYQNYPFERLVQKLNLPWDRSRNPLFDVGFGLLELDMEELQRESLNLGGLKVSACSIERKTAIFDLYMEVTSQNGYLNIALEYSTELFYESTASKMLTRYVEILQQIVQDRSIKLKDIVLTHDFIEPTTSLLTEARGDFDF